MMFIEQFISVNGTGYSYYIESSGIAAVIDPEPAIEKYIALAEKRNALIKYVFQTHLHASCEEGYDKLSKLTGAEVIVGYYARVEGVNYGADNAEYQLGTSTLKILQTPGHTFDSVCILMYDENHVPHSVFTGDTLLIGDIGRPEADNHFSLTEKDLAGMLYDSIHNRLLSLPGYVNVYPGRTIRKPGSIKEFSTIAQQKSSCFALKLRSRPEFINHVLETAQLTQKS